MKLVPLGRHGKIDAREILIGLLQTAPNGQTLGEMRRKLAVLEKIEAAATDADSVLLEDAEHQTLVHILETRNDFAVTSRDVIDMADGVIKAKAPEQPSR